MESVAARDTLCMGKAPYSHLCLEGRLGQFRSKESLLCIQCRSHFASTACNKYLKMELGKKKALTKLILPLQMQVLGSCSCGSHRKHIFCQSTSQPIFTRPPKAPLQPGDQDSAKCQNSVVPYSPMCESCF